MPHSRSLLPVVVVVGLAAGCDDASPLAAPAAAPPALAYPVRSEFLVVNLMGDPTKWNTPEYRPTVSLRLYPNTPDAALVEPLRTKVGKEIFDPLDPRDGLTPAVKERVRQLLVAAFGTPTTPLVVVPDPAALKEAVAGSEEPTKEEKAFGAFAADAAKAADVLKLSPDALARGGLVYRQWCIGCHGPSGAGDGVAGSFHGPSPRDYRQGLFKFVTALQPNVESDPQSEGRARRDDLARTIRNGLPGSIMPAFPTLKPAQIDDLVSYVVHLSVRGETEFRTLATVLQNEKAGSPLDPDAVGRAFAANETIALGYWVRAAGSPIPVPDEGCPTDDAKLWSAVRGAKVYAEFGCEACHTNYGRGNSVLKWDAWGGVVQPRNLTQGVYRGGGRGQDLYARLYGGIAASKMPHRVKEMRDAGTVAPGQPDKLWDLVHFLQTLPDPARRWKLTQLDPTIKIEP